MFKRMSVVPTFLVLLAGCAVTKVPTATGGSKSDGFIELSYIVGPFEKPVVNWNSALQTAIKRCNAWDYNSAESFGGRESQCVTTGPYGECTKTKIIINYQCTK